MAVSTPAGSSYMRSHAYFAGFFDGDGSVVRDHQRARLRVSGCHLPAMLAFREMYGGAVTYERSSSERPNCKPKYTWGSHGSTDAVLREWLQVDTSSTEFLTGYFDAEGCIHGVRKQARMQAGGYDPRVALLLRDRFDGIVCASVSDKGYHSVGKPAYLWLSNKATIQHALETLEPLMIEKREQAQVALRYYAGEITSDEMDEQLRGLKKVTFPLEEWAHVIDGKYGTRGDNNDDTGLRHRSKRAATGTDPGLAIDRRGGDGW